MKKIYQKKLKNNIGQIQKTQKNEKTVLKEEVEKDWNKILKIEEQQNKFIIKRRSKTKEVSKESEPVEQIKTKDWNLKF